MFIIDFILHIDQHLASFVASYGALVYGLLFLVVFVETGVVVMPLLPGDSLLFAAGALAAIGSMNPWLVAFILMLAAISGDSSNYLIGNRFGRRLIQQTRYIKPEYLHRTEHFFATHGGKTVIFARFVPIVRTFAPFVAGMGAMRYRRFLSFSVVGTVCWVSLFVSLGYFFGNLPMVRKNFTLVIFAIIGISFMPMLIETIKSWRKKSTAV